MFGGNNLAKLNISTCVPSSIVNKYIKNPTPLDQNSPDITTAPVALLCLKFYSLDYESTKNSNYLQFTNEAFKIISEEGGDILQSFNGQEIIAVWKDNEGGEEIQTVARRTIKCAQRIKTQLLSMVSVNPGSVTSVANSAVMSSGAMGSHSISHSTYTPSPQGVSSQHHQHNAGSFIPISTPPINIKANGNSASGGSGNSYHGGYSSTSNHSFPGSMSPSNMYNHPHVVMAQQTTPLHEKLPTIVQLQIDQSTTAKNHDISSSFYNHHILLQPGTNGASSGSGAAGPGNLSGSYSAVQQIAQQSHQSIQINTSSNININSPNQHYPSSSSHHLPSSPGKYSSPIIQRSNSSSQLQAPANCNYDPLFNIYIAFGDLYLGCLGGEDHTWLNIIGGEGTTKMNKMIRIYEEKYSISSLPVKLSFKRTNGNNNNSTPSSNISNSLSTSSNNLLGGLNTSSNSLTKPVNNTLNSAGQSASSSIKNIKSMVASSSPLSSPSTSPSTVLGHHHHHHHHHHHYQHPQQQNTTCQVFNQIIVNKDVFSLIKSYSVCDLLIIPSAGAGPEPLSASSSPQLPSGVLLGEEFYILKQMKELSKPVAFQVEKSIRELPPEHFIQIHNLLWCHLPVHVKALAQSASTPIPPSHNSESSSGGIGSALLNTSIGDLIGRGLFSQDWGLEPKSVTFLVIHFFSMSFTWDTFNFFHPVIVHLQRMIRRSDGTITNIIERESGIFVICAMGLPPFPSENHAMNGVKISMDISRFLQSQNRAFIRDANILVLTEKAICGMVGCKERSDYVLIGNNIHFAFQWLNTVLQNLVGPSTELKINNTEPLSFPLPPSLGGLILCDYQTKKLCGKSIIFENSSYSIHYKSSKFNVNSNNTSAAATSSNNNNTSFGNLAQVMVDNDLSDTKSVTSSIHSSHIGESINFYPASSPDYSEGDEALVFNTFKPLKLASAPTTKDRQQKLAQSKKKPLASSDSSQFLDYVLLGRSQEVSEIMAKVRITRASPQEKIVSSFIWIQGEPGVGKSSLVTEVYKECINQGGRVFCGSCTLLEKTREYSAWTGVFYDLFFSQSFLDAALEPEDDSLSGLNQSRYSQFQSLPQEKIREHIFQNFTDKRAEILPFLSFLNPILRVDFPSNDYIKSLSHPVLLEKTFELLIYFLRNIAYGQKMVIIIEDLQHMDEMSWKLLLYVACNISPITILCTSKIFMELPRDLVRIGRIFRGEAKIKQPETLKNSVSYEYHEMKLQPLSNEAIVDLIKRILGAKAVSNYVLEYVLPRSEGNPSVCYEIVKNLRDQNFITGHNDKYAVQPIYVGHPFPPFPDALESFTLLKYSTPSSNNNSFSIIMKSICAIPSGMKIPLSLLYLLCPLVTQKRSFFKEILAKLVEWGILESTDRLKLPPNDPLSFPLPSNLTHQSSISSTGSSSSQSLSSVLSFNSDKFPRGGDFNDGASTSSGISKFIKTAPSGYPRAGAKEKEFLSPSGQKGYLPKDEMFSTQPSGANHAFLNSDLYSSIISNDWDHYYSFKSPLLQESMYQSLLVPQKQLLHLKLAKWIEENYNTEELVNYHQQLAYHWSKTDLHQSSNCEKAIQYCFQAGEQVLRQGNLIDAIKFIYDYILLLKSYKYRQLGREFSFNLSDPNPGGLSSSSNSVNSGASLKGSKKAPQLPQHFLGENINVAVIKANDDEFQFVSFEEKMKYARAFKYMGLAYQGLGYFQISEAYLLQALSVLQEAPPKSVNSSVIFSLVGQFTKYTFKVGTSKKPYQTHREALEIILPNNVILNIEISKVLTLLGDIYYRSALLYPSLYCSARSIQLLVPHETQSNSSILPQLSISFSQLALSIILLPAGMTISQTFYKLALKSVNDLLPGYLELENIEAASGLVYTSSVLSFKELFTYSWDKVEASVSKINELIHKYPNRISSSSKIFHKFLDISYQIHKGELRRASELLETTLRAKLPWGMNITMNHLSALVAIYQSKFSEALKFIRDADLIRPSNDSLNLILHESLSSAVQFSFGKIEKAYESAFRVIHALNGRVTCGIRYIFALSIVIKSLLAIYESEKKKPNTTPPPLSPSFLSATTTTNSQGLQGLTVSTGNVNISKKAGVSTDDFNLKSSIKSSSDSMSPPPSPTSSRKSNKYNTFSSATLKNLIRQGSERNIFKSSKSSTSNPSASLSDSPGTLHASTELHLPPGIIEDEEKILKPSIKFDLPAIEMHVKKIIKSFKETEKGSAISMTTYQRLYGVFLIETNPTSQSKQEKGLTYLYKSAKESKSKSLVLEETLAWHEIYKYEESSSKKSIALQNSLDLYHKLNLTPWTLICELPKK